ncbi:MAG TPA: tetratricopeptide repeat protein [Polyangiaceae bacterium]|nr:tetratricopeptide repeat protein [Polyangiaceae bacterium]
MFKVECPGCKAPYQVDERRIPPSGLKMRCPKCGSSFKVDQPGDPYRTGPSPVLGAVFGVGADSLPPPALDASPPAVPRPAALKTTMLGVAPPKAAPAPAAAPAEAPPRPAPAPTTDELDLPAPAAPQAVVDLPAPAAPRKGPPPPPARAKPAAPVAPPAPAPRPASAGTGLELDLPDTTADLPAPAQRAAPAPRGAPAPAPAQRGGGAELPALRTPGGRVSSPSLDLDLPSVSAAGVVALPSPSPSPAPAQARAPRAPSPSFGEIELDLPAASDLPAARGARGTSGGHAIDLPNLRGVAPSVRPGGGIDLPSPQANLPSPQASNLPSPQATNLPSPRQGGSVSPSVGLPSLGGVGLPLVGAGAGLPVSSRGAGLPSVGGAGLPSAGGAGLPSAGGASLPSPGGGARFPSSPPLDLESPLAGPPSGGFGALDLEPIGGGPVVPSRAPAARLDDGLEADPFGEAPLPPPRSLAPSAPSLSPGAGQSPAFIPAPSDIGNPVIRESNASIVRQAGGGTAYGEVNLSFDAGADVSLDAQLPPARPAMPSEEDMEFGEVPQEREPGAGGPARAQARPELAEPLAPPSSAERRPRVPRAKAKLPVRTLASACVLLVGGASLGFLPQAGPFGAYWIIDRVKADEYAHLVADSAKKARTRLGSDTAPDAMAAAADVDSARANAPRVRGLSAYAAFLASMRELRFGPEPEVHARSKVLLDEFTGEGEAPPYLELARAARAATEGQLARARQSVTAVLRRTPNDIDALALSGEVELRARNDAAALAAWQALGKLESSARAAFGLSRAHFSAGDSAGAEREAKAALERNPRHAGAKILLARIAAATPGRDADAIAQLEQVAKEPDRASLEERVNASTLLGDIHIARSRISRAEAAYTEALKINPKAARALIGLGEALYRAGRYSEAQARFEAGAQADPDDVFAKVGVAKSKLMLERLEDAQASLRKLRESHPASLLVTYWYGRVLEAVGDRAGAERVYLEGIAKIKSDPLLVDTYIALALLQNQQGRAEEAQKTLATARERLPASAAIHRALGDVALSQGRYSDAQSELRQAINLDPEDLGARFRLGSALRRDRKFDEALAVFGEVGAVDAEYPGLALERGLLFEASNRTEEALKAYESALAKAPDDPDLMLRVGCGYATAARTKEAEGLLRKVLSLRPTSAETNHCLGRALLAEGSRLADALRMLERAVELDPNRPEFHLYVGWAANEAGNVPKAQRELDQAIALDQSLADAYWQRGVLRQRQGAVRDAVSDLTRALSLRPTRYEAHAALADAYYDLGREPAALAEWQKAVAAQPDNATWHFRYGKLLVDNHMNDAARAELTLALSLAEKKPRGERWIWEAHHRMARAIGQRPDAIPHWEAFLRLGPLDSPYRAEAKTALEQLGRPWAGN